MKVKIRAKVQVTVEKTIEAPSIEDALARARKMGFRDFVWVAAKTSYFTDTVKIEIKGLGK